MELGKREPHDAIRAVRSFTKKRCFGVRKVARNALRGICYTQAIRPGRQSLRNLHVCIASLVSDTLLSQSVSQWMVSLPPFLASASRTPQQAGGPELWFPLTHGNLIFQRWHAISGRLFGEESCSEYGRGGLAYLGRPL